jgi:hypothetical protein
MKIFGAQNLCPLDKFKPYQRPKLSDGGHEARRLQLRRPAAVRCSAWLGHGSLLFITNLVIDLHQSCPDWTNTLLTIKTG